MTTIGFAKNLPGYRMNWAPPASKTLGQQQAVPFLESPLLSFVTSLTVLGATGFLATLYTIKKNNISNLWWIIAAAAGMKTLHDMSRL